MGLGATDVWATTGGHKVDQMSVGGEGPMRPLDLKFEKLIDSIVAGNVEFLLGAV